MIKSLIHEENKVIISIYTPRNEVWKYTKQKLNTQNKTKNMYYILLTRVEYAFFSQLGMEQSP